MTALIYTWPHTHIDLHVYAHISGYAISTYIQTYVYTHVCIHPITCLLNKTNRFRVIRYRDWVCMCVHANPVCLYVWCQSTITHPSTYGYVCVATIFSDSFIHEFRLMKLPSINVPNYTIDTNSTPIHMMMTVYLRRTYVYARLISCRNTLIPTRCMLKIRPRKSWNRCAEIYPYQGSTLAYQ